METQTWLFVALLAAACIPLTQVNAGGTGGQTVSVPSPEKGTVKWEKDVGDSVADGDVVAKIEIEEGDPVDVPSPAAGEIKAQLVENDKSVEVGNPLFELKVTGETPVLKTVTVNATKPGKVMFYKGEEEAVSKDEPILQITDDKPSSVPIKSPADGKILELLVQNGNSVQAGDDLFKFQETGKDEPSLVPATVTGKVKLEEGIEDVQEVVKDQTVLEIETTEGQSEDVKSPEAGVIKKLLVGNGTTVNEGASLLELQVNASATNEADGTGVADDTNVNGTETITEAMETVTKKDFDIIGVRMKSYLGRNFNAFCGIPYAEPPVGLRRFRLSQMMKYDGTIDATKCEETPICMQIRWDRDEKDPIGSEDCLYLNVYEPETESTNLPVIVYFHGGGFFSGSGTFNDAGPHYFMDQDVILVTINYRLGPLGFFGLNIHDAPGNLGLYDQVTALHWVQNYIKHFHGDLFRVTIMGEGAGGACVHLHLFSPMSRGLFSRAISQTGVAFSPWALGKNMVNTSETHAAILGCYKDKPVQTLKCLKELEAEEIVKSTRGLHYWLNEPLVIYRPMVQEHRSGTYVFLPRHPMDLLLERDFRNVPWLVGVVNTPGFFHTKRYLTDDVMLTALLGKFDEYGAAMLDMHRSIPDAEEREAAMSKIKEIYETMNGAFNRDSVVQMFNDREHNLGQMLAVTYHALLFHENIYQYRFDYRGVHSMAENVSAVNENETVNEDELIYLLKRPALFPDFNRTNEEGKRDFQMMQKLTSIWAEFAATGHVKALYRSKRESAVLTKLPTDTAGTGQIAELVSRLLSRQRRTQNEEEAVDLTAASGASASFPHGGGASDLSGASPRKWKEFVTRTYQDKTTCWDSYSSTVWPDVRRFPFTAGNVPKLPYMSFRKGGKDTPVEFCLRYLMEFDRLIHWTQLPLEELKLPDVFLNFTTTTGPATAPTTVTESTTYICPTMPVSIPAEEPQTTLGPQPSPTVEPPVIPPEPVVPPGPQPPLPPPPPPPPPPTLLPTTAEEHEPYTPQVEDEAASETVPDHLEQTFTWPQYPKPPDPTQPTVPHISVDLPPLTTKPASHSELPFPKPTPPSPTFHRQTFTWTFTTEAEAPPEKPAVQARPPKPVAHKPHHEKPKGKAPPRSGAVWSYISLLLLLLLVVQF